MRILLIGSCLLFSNLLVFAQSLSVVSPNKKVKIDLLSRQSQDDGEWYLKVSNVVNGSTYEVIPQITLGIVRSDQEFSKNLRFLKAGKPRLINENYTAIHGKRSHCSNLANEVVVSFETRTKQSFTKKDEKGGRVPEGHNELNTFSEENPGKAKMNLILRAYNDGVVFRYEFPEKGGNFKVHDELTSYIIPDSAVRWLQKFDLSNEGLYHQTNYARDQGNWSYPALFNSPDSASWYLIHEADVDRSYCATKLSNYNNPSAYKVTLPHPGEGEGEAFPTIALPWKSPWRVIILGGLSEIVESTLVDDVSTPSVITNTDWIKPGLVSWNYWSDNHGTRDFKTVCKFADLAAEMNWPYTLLDWEWDAMENGGTVEDAAKYILSQGVKPLIWYNSGMFKWITATPRDRLFTHESRMKEFAWLKSLGFVGVKIDFFLSEKQYMIQYYLDILEDAAKSEMMVYFHGCLVPRGWTRTFPHLMTYEGVRGAEWYNNGPELTLTAPEHNTHLPFTRNVVGSMDYTPVTFTNSQYPHVTSYGHELALSVLFESALQHMADRPEGYENLPNIAKNFIRHVPAAWDDTKLLDGYPGKDVMIARRKGETWYIGGINGELKEKTKTIPLDFLQKGTLYKLTLIADGKHDKEFSTRYLVVNSSSSVEVRLLRRGGFAAYLEPIR